MPIYDPAWDMPETNWRPVGSFQQAAPSPGVDPTAEPVVCIPVNAAWVKVLIGCIDQLCIPATWAASSDDDLNGILQWVALLKQQVANAESCMQLRWSDADCAVEQSADGGVTWVKISGWPAGPPACFVGATGATGATGAAGAAGPAGPAGPASIWRLSGCALQYSNDGGSTWTTASGWDIAALAACLPGSPPVVGGVSTSQLACNVSGYLADKVIQGSLAQAYSSFNAGQSLVAFAAALVGVVFGLGVFSGVFAAAAAVLYDSITSATASDFNAASTDATLKSELICALYNAINGVGYVDSTNFAVAETALRSVVYAHAEVVTAIGDYWHALGLSGVSQVQNLGALAVYDCSACVAAGPVGLFNGTNDYLSTGARLVAPGAGAFSVSAWIRPAASGSFPTWISEIGTSNLAGEFLLRDRRDLGGILEAFRRSGSGTAGNVYRTSATIPDTTWTHVLFVSTGIASGQWYINGVAATTTVIASVYTAGAAATTIIGADEIRTAPAMMNGKLADLRAWNVALSAIDAAAIHGAGVIGYQPAGSPADWWRFNEGAGGTAADSAGGHTATWQGSGAHWSTT